MITETTELATVVAELRRAGLAALDTEFVWERTYYPVLGIVQMGAADGRSWILDARSSVDPRPLRELLEDVATVKILHDARQDLTLLGRYAGAVPRAVFDTRIAAGFAGFSSTISLQNLLRDALGVELAKTETRTDWCRRPLSEAQLDYALDDVRHLGQLREVLMKAAEERGAGEWLADELRQFDDPALYLDRAPEEAWLRMKGGSRLPPSGRSVLRALAALRESEAAARNLPRAWLLADDTLVELAFKPPKDLEDLASRKILPPGLAGSLAEPLLEAVHHAMKLPPEDCPELAQPRIEDAVKKRADGILGLLRERAAALRIDAALFGNRAQITAFAMEPGSDPEHPLMKGWRFEAGGRDLLERMR